MTDIADLKADPLLAFCLVIRLGSVSEAAARLGLSQPAVSRQLAGLQKATGTRLYRRTPRGVEPTAAGADLLPYACAVAQSLALARRFVRGELAPGPISLRLGLSKHLVAHTTGPLLKAARGYNDRVGPLELHLVEGYSLELTEQLLQRRLDAAVILSEPGAVPAPLVAEAVGSERIGLLTLPDDPIAAMGRVPLAVVEGETLILPSSESRLYRLCRDLLGRERIRPGRVVEVSGPAAVRSAVLAGQGVGVTLASFVKAETEAGWLRCAPLEDDGFVVTASRVVQPADTLAPPHGRALEALFAAPLLSEAGAP